MAKEHALFYHVWAPSVNRAAWRFLVDEQLKRIYRAGVARKCEVFCCISTDDPEVASFVARRDWVNIVEISNETGKYEGLTLDVLFDKASAFRAVAYIHTKGIRYFATDCPIDNFIAINSWRHWMESIVIDRFEESLEKLNNFDCVGVNYLSHPWPHFGGNMWWASSSYVLSLQRPTSAKYDMGPDLQLSAVDERRVSFERWIGSGEPKAYSFRNQPFITEGQDVGAKNLYFDDIAPFCYFEQK